MSVPLSRAARCLQVSLSPSLSPPSLLRLRRRYVDQFRVLALNLPRNPALCRNLVAGLVGPADLARLTSEDLASDAARASAAKVIRRLGVAGSHAAAPTPVPSSFSSPIAVPRGGGAGRRARLHAEEPRQE